MEIIVIICSQHCGSRCEDYLKLTSHLRHQLFTPEVRGGFPFVSFLQSRSILEETGWPLLVVLRLVSTTSSGLVTMSGKPNFPGDSFLHWPARRNAD